jgi:hypothetical protein
MARRAHDLHRALDVNENRTRMRNRAIARARVCVIQCARTWRRIANVSGAAAGTDYAAHMRLRSVLSRMSLLWRAV